MSSKPEVVWPPQTTQDVINLTPRKSRLAAAAATSLPPSPLRKSTMPKPRAGSDLDNDDDDDEDEEMLKLKLAQIEAKLRLKKLQKKKSAAGGLGPAPTSQPAPAAAPEVQVPASPTRKSVAPPSPKSPSRVLLGIDKGLKGRDVSLRRAPSLRNPGRPASSSSLASVGSEPLRPIKSFSERIAEERAREKARAERLARTEASRSKGFGLMGDGASSSPRTGSFASSGPGSASGPGSFSSAVSKPEPPTSSSSAARDPPASAGADEETADEAGFDSFSGLRLARRATPHTTVARQLSPRHVFQLPHLLKCVVAPHFDPPDVAGDWVALGVICSKSDPRDVGQNTTAKHTGKKYMVLQLTDLKWELELFLFGAGFDRWRRLPVGTLVALLNPGILKPRNADTGRFSLTLADGGDDCLLEIGVARDLAFCKAVRRDGRQCAAWVDARHTEFCAFHVEQSVKKARVGRAEVNSMTKLFSPPSKGSMRPRKFFGTKGAAERDDGLLGEGPIADVPTRLGGAGGKVFVAPGRSTAQLLDDEDYLGDPARGTKEERLQRRLAEGKKERELVKRLIAAQGREGGLGTEYLKSRVSTLEAAHSQANGTEHGAERRQISSALASLRSRSASTSTISLSPVKRKRPVPAPAHARTSSTSASTSASMSAYAAAMVAATAPPLPPPARPKSWTGAGAGARAVVSPTSERVVKKTRFDLPSSDSDDDLEIVM